MKRAISQTIVFAVFILAAATLKAAGRECVIEASGATAVDGSSPTVTSAGLKMKFNVLNHRVENVRGNYYVSSSCGTVTYPISQASGVVQNHQGSITTRQPFSYISFTLVNGQGPVEFTLSNQSPMVVIKGYGGVRCDKSGGLFD